MRPDPEARLRSYLDGLVDKTPALAGVVAAFGPLLIQQALVKDGLPPLTEPQPEIDASRLAAGVPLAPGAALLDGLDLTGYLRDAAPAILPALEQGLPALRGEVAALASALPGQAPRTEECLLALLDGEQAGCGGLAEGAGVSPEVLGFMLLALAKPLLEQRAVGLAPLLQGREWSQGCCPICGALPELAFLQGEGGQRWLRCSCCAHHWRFARMACPVCGNQDPEKREFFFAEGQERERVDYCTACGKYLLTLDLRGLDQKPMWAAAALGLVHLDLVARERGLVPAAVTPWNQLGSAE
ncbi:MAG: formate dehydrogenase accessory protein FdhE [Desulfarculaceae bacterium]|nr:formate dehydrogenase accessory protein FdhE [Desulfarculaceae bacterium]MCF8071546.1 formate dehydrogenase accessory protein FdhE [Desulfarculaceae bacterium]MCF8102361.1 formate dehydrogenase accessory protein FdhE [Desulfarculaceae bacterium]MCF8114825.1 formate dehydrogenase accessory protein FdhE [Desulfarculaceae bacterium]